MPRGAGGHGRIRGAGGCWDVYGLSATGQGAGWAGVQCGCCAPLPLWIWGWTLGWIWGCILGWLPSGEHRQVFSPCLLCRVWKRVWIKPQGLASLPATRGAGEEPAPPHGPETSIPQAVPPDQAWLAAAPQPLSPGSKGSGGRGSAGCRQCIPLPPSAACKAAWPWLHHPPGPSSAWG